MANRWFIVYNESGKVVHETYDEPEAQRIADEEDGWVEEVERTITCERCGRKFLAKYKICVCKG